MNIGILAAGSIAHTMARTVRDMAHPEIRCTAVASRSAERAESFAREFSLPHSYGSYEAMLEDKSIDLVYVASPHSQHYEHIKMTLEAGKHVLCEKAFTTDAAQAREVFALAKEKKLLLTEAIWTRYMPSRTLINELAFSGLIGEPSSVQASLGYPLAHVERLVQPELAGGALLDLGVYPINFAMMVFGDEVESQTGSALMSPKGVDLMESITLSWDQKRLASLHANMLAATDKRGLICADKGYIIVENINNPQLITAFDKNGKELKRISPPAQVSGYEYELEACLKALTAGELECSAMPHSTSIKVMEIADALRAQWGMRYPWEH